jgi:hypothetical protein
MLRRYGKMFDYTYVQDYGNGENNIVNPDGTFSASRRKADGSLHTEYSDGMHKIEYADGSEVTFGNARGLVKLSAEEVEERNRLHRLKR